MRYPSRIVNPMTGALCALAFAAPALAEEEEGWSFDFAPLFLWGVSIDGDATIGPATAPLELGFKDEVLENLDTVLTFHFEAHNGRLTLLAEYQYLKLKPSTATGPVEVDVEFENVAIEGALGWEFFRDGDTSWMVLGGLRYLDQDVEVDGNINLPPPPLGPGPQPLGISGGDDWVHPFVGVRSRWSINPRWTLLTRGDFGYESGDNRALNLSAMAHYHFRDWGSVFFGYRYMDFDYDNRRKESPDRYAYNAAQQGPLLGINFRW